MKTWIALFCFALLAVSPASHAQDSDSLTWARANSCERIRDYIARYPSGRYLAQARAQLTARNCPAPQASTPADPCVQARADWAAIATSSDLGVLRAFRNAAPAACAVQRAQADARIADVQRAAETAARLPQRPTSTTAPRAAPQQEIATASRVGSSASPTQAPPHSERVSSRVSRLARLNEEVRSAALRDEEGYAVWVVAQRIVESGAPYSPESDVGLIVETLGPELRNSALEFLFFKAVNDNNIQLALAWSPLYRNAAGRALRVARWGMNTWVVLPESDSLRSRVFGAALSSAEGCSGLQPALGWSPGPTDERAECAYISAVLHASVALQYWDLVGEPHPIGATELGRACALLTSLNVRRWSEMTANAIRGARGRIRQFAPACSSFSN